MKGKDDAKECDTVCQQEEHRQVRKKRARSTEVERLQIAEGAQVSPTKCSAIIGEQKKPRTKIAKHKGAKGNVGSGKDVEEGNERWEQKGGATKKCKHLNQTLSLCTTFLYQPYKCMVHS